MADIKAPPLNPGVNPLKLAEAARNTWSVEIPPGVLFGSILRPDFWTHCTRQFKQYDLVECRAQDNEWFGTLMVASVDKLSIKMWPLSRVALSLPEAVLPVADEYTISLGGPHKWRIIRLVDKEVIHFGEPTKESAEKWLADFVAGKVTA